MKKSKLLSVFGGVFLFVSLGMLVFLMAASSQQELIYSTYVEGQGCDIAVDSEGYAYVARFAGSKVPGNPGGISTVVSKIDAAGTGNVEWHTWMGGSARQSHDRPGEIAMDSDGNIYIAGRTNSPDFLTTDGTTLTDESHYLVMLSKDGTVLYSTVFGTYSGALKVGVGVGGGYVYVAGGSNDDVWLAQFIQSGDALSPGWSTSLGGNGLDYGQSVAVDSEGNAYVTGLTCSSNMTDQNGVTVILTGQSDVFVAKYSSEGDLLYLTTLGGNEAAQQGNEELGFGIAVNESGCIYVTGRMTSADFTTTSGAVNPTYLGGRDAFLAVLEPIFPDDYSLLYSTYLGGSNLDRGRSVAVDAAGYVYVSAWTASNDVFTTPDAYKPSSRGDDAFLWVLNPGEVGSDSLVSATYLGGTKADRGRGVRVHIDGSIYMTGMTGSRNFPVSPNAYLDTPQSGFVSVLAWQEANDPPEVEITKPTDGATFSSGETVNFAGTASDTEDGDLTAGLVWNSSIDENFWTGGSFSTSSLSDGTHTITASVTDSGGQAGSDSTYITVGETPPLVPISVVSITYSLSGGKKGDKNLNITVELDKPVLGAVVSINLEKNENPDRSFSGITDSSGIVTFTRANANRGTYTSDVIDVTAAGYDWDGGTPANGFTK